MKNLVRLRRPDRQAIGATRLPSRHTENHVRRVVLQSVLSGSDSQCPSQNVTFTMPLCIVAAKGGNRVVPDTKVETPR